MLEKVHFTLKKVSDDNILDIILKIDGLYMKKKLKNSC